MALRKITQPEFEITLPVIKKKVKFRPFLVKEEKLLLVGKEGGAGDQLNSIKQVLTNVVLSPKNFDPSDLTVTDIEYLFMHLRGKSVNNIVKLKYKDKEDEQLYDFELDINEIEPTIDPNRSSYIRLSQDYSTSNSNFSHIRSTALVKQSRLSVMPIDAKSWKIICNLGGIK